MIRLFFLFLMMLSLPVLYNNCGAMHEGIGANSSLSVKDKMKVEFKSGFHTFLKTNCSSCHVAGGQGSGKFAGSDLELAYSDFYGIGYTKVAQYAVDKSHNFPYTGPQNQEQIDSLVAKWEDALLRAYAGSEAEENTRDLSVFTESRLISLVDSATNRVVRWVVPQNIESSTTSLVGLNDVIIEAQINLVETDGNLVGYAISRPRLVVPATSSTGVRLSGIESLINDELLEANTFSNFSVCVKPGESAYLSTSGSTVVDMNPLVTDRLAVATYGLKAENCLSPEDYPEVNFAVATASFTELSPGANYGNSSYPFIDVKIILSEPALADSQIKASVQSSSTAFRRLVGDKNRFDWDFDYNDTTVQFKKGDIEKTVRIYISDDERDEANETVSLVLENPMNLQIGTTSTHVLTITDDDLPLGANEVSYSQVMNNIFLSSGLGGCIDCHSSKSSAGGLDITDYKKMIRTGVVFSQDLNNSALYQRTKGVGGSIMPPGSSGLSSTEYKMIEDWINAGAKNN